MTKVVKGGLRRTKYNMINNTTVSIRCKLLNYLMDCSNNCNKVEVKLLLFAKAKELASTGYSTIKLPTRVTGNHILQEIITNIPSLASLASNLMLALNQTYIDLEETMDDNNYIKITQDSISIEEVSSWVSHPSAGAISVFLGTTRDHFEGKKVLQLDYEAYEPMAIKELKKICEDIRKKWTVVKIAIFHRIGTVPIGETSVAIAISSVHRKDAIEAVQYCIDTLKLTVPIWKKELYEDGESSWKENTKCCGGKDTL